MSPERMLAEQVAGIKEVRHRPTRAKAVEITANNVESVARWVQENGGSPATISVNDPQVGWRELKYGDVVMQGTHGEFYGISKEVYQTNYEDVTQEG